MPIITFFPAKVSVHVESGTTLLDAARKADVVIESPCNAVGTCGKCKVRLTDPALAKNMKSSGKHHLSLEEESQGYVLACQTEALGDVSVETVEKQQNKTLKILNKGKSFDIAVEPYIKKQYFPLVQQTVIQAAQAILGYEDGDTQLQNYGVVVDIGTTTLVASLVDLNTGREMETASSLNPQAVYAQDVLSRIKYASEEEGLKTLNSKLIEELNGLIGEITKNSGVSREFIYEVIFSGNTCMLHLAANVNPRSLGRYPYVPEVSGGSHIPSADLDLQVSRFGIVYLPPIISAYVGADITSGILAAQLKDKKGVTLFVDIGTNGEMVIGFDGRLSATSTAAGPAFEGMNITYGMRAGNGAIELFSIEKDGSITVKTIGDSKPIGICGSGLLDIVGELVGFGVINKSGKFIDPETEGLLPSLKERLVKVDGKTVFIVAEGIYLSQKDVRQVQLAKGAVRAGIEFLMVSKEVQAADVDRVLIAGSFGYHLRAKSLLNIGLLPAEFEGRIDFIGNTSKSGGQAFLLNNSYRQQMENTVREVEVIELANYKNFDKVFVQCLNF